MTGYTGNPATVPTDELRLIMGDTSATPYLTDAEVTYLYNKWGVFKGAYKGCLHVAAKYSGEYNISLGDLSISASQVQAQFSERAKELMREYNKEIKGAYSIPMIGRTHSALDYPDELKHSDKKDARWFNTARASSDYDYENPNE